ncbi:GerW family sporulation protein [Halomarina litorea]|uniref:GerW family sporulation protein n=1 Tax=Halomarina litorea TaxID=2961595 RepID=UPI0020C45585|nr:spore germination protein GerW family protein [Halomarina sp. BCD28]
MSDNDERRRERVRDRARRFVDRLGERRGHAVSVIERLSEAASVEAVYGDPLTVDGRTVIPVARVAYGFGGGYDPMADREKGASGGGGGVRASPVGVLEVTEGETRFVRFGRRRRTIGAFAVGVLVGALAAYSRARRGER